jgi:hypothetical protein
MHRERFLRWIVFLAVVCAAVRVEAQPQIIPRFDFSFSNPGARSLGFGGAFSALADDATAAYANPAGLVQLTELEVSFESRLWNRTPSFVSGGRLDGEPTGQGIDTRRGLTFDRDGSQDFGPSFASVVLPKGRWSFALYGHQLARFEQSAESQGFFSDEDLFFPFGLFRSPALREKVELDAVSGGAAAGWRMNDRISFGLGLVASNVSLKTKSDFYFPGRDQFERVDFLPEAQLYSLGIDVDGTAVTVNAGLLGRVTDQLTSSFFYRQGAEVDGTASFVFGPAFPVGEPVVSKAVFKVPDVAGAGLAYRSKGGRVTLAAEADWVGYSDLLQVEDSEGLDYQDTWEYHIGAEYALLRTTPIVAFRAGGWIQTVGDSFTGDREVKHWSVGGGIAARTVQIDVGGDFSDEGNTASLSFIYNF